jgi:hypothetical protein
MLMVAKKKVLKRRAGKQLQEAKEPENRQPTKGSTYTFSGYGEEGR